LRFLEVVQTHRRKSHHDLGERQPAGASKLLDDIGLRAWMTRKDNAAVALTGPTGSASSGHVLIVPSSFGK